MVKLDLFPSPVVVALAAFGAQLALVDVVLTMAANAFLRSLLEVLRFMAGRAFRRDMFPSEREVRLVMIELGFFPVRLGMTALAVWAKDSLMYIVLAVTRFAIVRCLAEFLSSRVARDAFHSGMFAEQHKIRKPVVEADLVQLDDLRRSAQMLGVAFPARFLGN